MITINVYVLLAIIEIMIALFCLVFVFYKKSKKLAAYSDLKKSKTLIIKQFLSTEFKYTKHFINDVIANRKTLIEPYKSQLYLLKNRLQWLALEKSFLEVPKNKEKFWSSLIKHIDELSLKWNTNKKANNKNIPAHQENDELVSSFTPPLDHMAHHEDENIAQGARRFALEKQNEALLSEIESLKQKDKFNKKKIRNLWSYKNFYQEVSEAYKKLQLNYRQLRVSIDGLPLNEEQTKIIDPVLTSQSNDEKNLEIKISTLEKDNTRLQQELKQLEEIYNLHLHENAENPSQASNPNDHITTEDSNESSPAVESATQDQQSSEIEKTDEQANDGNWDVESDPEFQFAEKGKTLTTDQDNVINQHVNFIEQLPLSADEKTSLINQTQTIQKNNFELMACYQVLSLDNERLASDVETLKKQLVNVVKTRNNAA